MKYLRPLASPASDEGAAPTCPRDRVVGYDCRSVIHVPGSSTGAPAIASPSTVGSSAGACNAWVSSIGSPIPPTVVSKHTRCRGSALTAGSHARGECHEGVGPQGGIVRASQVLPIVNCQEGGNDRKGNASVTFAGRIKSGAKGWWFPSLESSGWDASRSRCGIQQLYLVATPRGRDNARADRAPTRDCSRPP